MDKMSEMDNTRTEDLSPFPSDIAYHCTITIRVHKFSSCSEFDITEHAECVYDDDAFKEHVAPPKLWFDGPSSENDTHISIGFFPWRSSSTDLNSNAIELRCVASVVDASRKKVFSQSLAYASDFDSATGGERRVAMLSFDKFIKRSSLLNSSSELLPGDTLTLCMDIDYKIQCRYLSSVRFEDFGHLGHCINGEGEFCIHMDSAYGQNLRKLSNVLQNMMEFPMAESTSRLLPVPSEERYYFQLLYHIIKEDVFILSTIGCISKIYTFADKYDMQPIMKLCRDLMVSVLLTINSVEVLNHVSKDIHTIAELAERFIVDESLKEIVTMYSDIKSKLEGGTGEPKAADISKNLVGKMDKTSEMDNSRTGDLPRLPPDIAYHCTITIRVHRFSTCCELDITERAEYEYDDEAFEEHVAPPMLWFDGPSSESDTHISIGFHPWRSSSTDLNSNAIELRCVASVIDASRNKVFSQSLAYASDFDSATAGERRVAMLGFDKFIKRSFLLNNSSELLPDDSLTLCLDIDYGIRCSVLQIQYRNSTGQEDLGNLGHCINEEGEFCIHMDSAQGQNLCKLSNVFQNMMEFPMAESTSRLFPVPPEEQFYFDFLYDILKEDVVIHNTIGSISKIYTFADKYDMQPIMKLCRDWMVSILLTINSIEVLNYVSKDIHTIAQLAERFVLDESLKEILTMYSDIKSKLEGGTGEPKAADISKVETEWICEYKGDYFQFSKHKSEQMDFYK